MTSLPPLSPLHPLPGLAGRLGISEGRLLVLREDLIGVHGGGNKVRKGTVAVDRARERGARTVVTTGAPQSNHARAVASIAAHEGMACVLVLEGEDPGERVGNLLLEEFAGAELVWAGADDPGALAAGIAATRDASTLIPFGGSDPAAVEVYVEVGQHLLDAVPDLAMAIVAVGSGATAAGLIAALGPHRVVAVDTGAVPDPTNVLRALLEGARPTGGWEQAPFRIERGQVGTGYEHAQPHVVEAVRTVLRSDGVLFDVTYAGRALAGLVARSTSGELPDEGTIVLVHTGGLPGLFGHPGLRGFRAEDSGAARDGSRRAPGSGGGAR